jgi:hypothetical protein
VITIKGLCADSQTAAPKQAAADCKTEITRAEFEKLTVALNPQMPPGLKQQLGNFYGRLLIFANAAEKRGLDKTPRFQELLRFARLQTLAQDLTRNIQEEATKVPAAEVEKHYAANKDKFLEGAFKRLYIPRSPAGSPKPDDKATETAMKGLADKMRQRAAAGEDFDKLEKEAYDTAKISGQPPSTALGTLRRGSLPPNHEAMFDLKDGETSQVISDPAGYYIYKLESKRTVPLEGAKVEIERVLAQERMRTAMDAITSSATATLNEAYFGAGGEREGREGRPEGKPEGKPEAKPGPTQPKPGAPPAKPSPPTKPEDTQPK